MKINEIHVPKSLFETIDAKNASGYLTEDLVKIVEAHTDNQWSKPMTLAEMDALEDQLLAESKNV